MAIISMDFGNIGGGTETSTVLWSNSSTSSDFAGQTITLNDDITNYDYIELKWKYYKTDADTNATSLRIPTADFIAVGTYSTQNKNRYIIGSQRGSNNFMARTFCYESNTSIKFDVNYYIATTGSANSQSIPISISGIKI